MVFWRCCICVAATRINHLRCMANEFWFLKYASVSFFLFSFSLSLSLRVLFYFFNAKEKMHQQRAIDLCRKSKVTLWDMHNAHVLYSSKIKALPLLTFFSSQKNIYIQASNIRNWRRNEKFESENWEDMNKKYKLQALTTYHNFSTANTRSALNPDDL